MDDIRMLNEAFYTSLIGGPGMEKRAVDAVNEFTRFRMREEGFWRKIMPPLTITNEQLDRRIEHDKPYKIIDKEPDSPAAMTVPFATLPMFLYIRAPRYPVTFDRIMTRRFQKDVDELRTYHMDVRQIFSDNSVKDALAEEDSKFLTCVDGCLYALDTVVPHTGAVQWQSIHGGVTREGLQDSFKIMPKAPGKLEVNTVLVNNIFIREVLKFGRDEFGGDKSQDLLVNGWSDQEFMRARWLITIKHDLVGDDTQYMFADPSYIGKAFELVPPTMHVKREAFMVDWFIYELVGGAIGNIAGLARADYV